MTKPSHRTRLGTDAHSRRPTQQHSIADKLLFRIGALGLGLVGGLVNGVLFLLPLSVVGLVDTPTRQLLVASTVSSGLCGLLVPRLALVAIEGNIHFLAGALSIVMESSAYDADSPPWLRAALVVGMLYAGGIVVLIHAGPTPFS